MTAASSAANLASPKRAAGRPRLVIVASSLGTVFEWYDFYLYGTLAVFFGAKFFPSGNETATLLANLAVFGAGFGVRPFGAVVFGHLGDLWGRKHTFLLTIVIMGLSTVLVGLAPTYDKIGILAPILLVVLRLAQGLALGGEYGGAATYVAEHAPPTRRGLDTSWIQTTASLGLFLALIVILGCRAGMSDAAFKAWGWRLPFLASALLLVISVYIRLQLDESPLFAAMKAEGRGSKNPFAEAFGRWANTRWVLLAIVGMTMGQGVVFYASQFQALFFLQNSLHLDYVSAYLMIMLALALATPFFLVFGALSDRIGRKVIILTGCALAAALYFPLFHALAGAVNPGLIAAQRTTPATVAASHCETGFFKKAFDTHPKTPCDKMMNALYNSGVNYRRSPARADVPFALTLGSASMLTYDASAKAWIVTTAVGAPKAFSTVDPDKAKASKAGDAALATALKAAAYPTKADPAHVDWVRAVAILWVLVLLVTMVYGPIAAYLVELFPVRIRYSAMSLPYHIGNGWFGGFLPFFMLAIAAFRGDIFAGLWYPAAISAVTVVIGGLLLPETRGRDIAV